MTDFGPGYEPIRSDIAIGDLMSYGPTYIFLVAGFLMTCLMTSIAIFYLPVPFFIPLVFFGLLYIPWAIGAAMTYFVIMDQNIKAVKIKFFENNKDYNNWIVVKSPDVIFPISYGLSLLVPLLAPIFGQYMHDHLSAFLVMIVAEVCLMYSMFLMSAIKQISQWLTLPTWLGYAAWAYYEMALHAPHIGPTPRCKLI